MNAFSSIPVLIPGLAAASAQAAETALPRPGLDQLGSGALVQMMAGLVIILVLIGAAAWLLRRYAPLRGGNGVFKIRGALAVGARERLVLVEVGEVRLLLGVAPGRVQTLYVFGGGAGQRDFAAELAATEGLGHARR